MNIHPIFVHFPIALLTIYALMELIRFKKVTMLPYWITVKASFLIIGSLTSFIALQTGELAEHAFGQSKLVEMHSFFAIVSSDIFAVLACIYLIILIHRSSGNIRLQKYRIWNILSTIAEKIFASVLPLIFAFIGLISITITGALGGAIVYGPDIDPVVHFIYGLFF